MVRRHPGDGLEAYADSERRLNRLVMHLPSRWTLTILQRGEGSSRTGE